MTGRFVVGDVFDIASRVGVILSGVLDGGNITVGTTLQDQTSGGIVRVIGVEFHTKPGRYAIVVAREAFVPPRDAVLVVLDRPA